MCVLTGVQEQLTTTYKSQWFAVVVNWYIDRVRVVAKRLSYYMLVLLEDIAEVMVTFVEQNLCLVRNKNY